MHVHRCTLALYQLLSSENEVQFECVLQCFLDRWFTLGQLGNCLSNRLLRALHGSEQIFSCLILFGDLEVVYMFCCLLLCPFTLKQR